LVAIATPKENSLKKHTDTLVIPFEQGLISRTKTNFFVEELDLKSISILDFHLCVKLVLI
jgi:hypothetical protein